MSTLRTTSITAAVTGFVTVTAVSAICLTAAAAAQRDVRVVGVEVKGNKNVAADKILGVTRVHVGDTLEEDKLEKEVRDQDLQAISKMGLFADQAVRLVPTKDGVRVVYELVENPKIRTIDLKGNSLMEAKELLELMKTKPGLVLNTNVLKEDLDKILRLYASKGAKARIVDIDVAKDDRLTVTIAEEKIEKIVIEGNVRTRAYVIQREMLSKEGDLLDYAKIRTEQRRILSLGFFDEITPMLAQGSTQDSTIYRLVLKERKTGGAAGGVGFSGQDGLLGYLEATEQNAFGRGQQYSARLERGSKGSRTYELSFIEPWLDPHRTSLGLSLYDRQVIRHDSIEGLAGSFAYSERRTGGELALSRPLDSATKLSLKSKIERTLSSVPDRPTYVVPGDGSTRAISLGYSRDTRDSMVNPRTGYQLSASAEFAGALLGGDNTFQKLMVSGSAYRLVLPGQTVALRATLGKVFCSDVLPSQERFRIGGLDSIRGYDYGTFQGDSMAYINLEYRFPIMRPVSGVVFADAGDAWYGAEARVQPKLGMGLGIRLDTALGLVGVDYGVSKGPDGKLRGRAVFSMGQTF